MTTPDKADVAISETRWGNRLTVGAIYAVAGIFHLATPDTFLKITPGWVPYPRETIIATGICELLGAAGLLNARTRGAAGVALALYAICVYPANIKHAVDGLSVGSHGPLGWWYHIPRLAFQPVFVWWALFAGGLVDWPFNRRR